MNRVFLVVALALAGAVAVYAMRNAADRPEPVALSAAQAVPVAGEAGVVHVFLTMTAFAPDHLLSVASPEASQAAITGLGSAPVALPAGGTPGLSSDGVFIVLSGVEGPLDEGRLIPVTLTFESGGPSATRARVLPGDAMAAMGHDMGQMPGLDGAMQGMGQDMDASGGGDAGTMASHAGMTGHGDMALAPEIALAVDPDGQGGWTVTLQTEAFTFTPDTAEPVHVAGEGHGHLYLDGLKLQRMYGETATIGALPSGTYTVEVSINRNDHAPYVASDGTPIAARQTITVP